MPNATNPFTQLLPDLTPKPAMVPGDVFKGNQLDQNALDLLKRAGVTANMLAKNIEADIRVAYERYTLYQEIERALEHWFVGPAVDLYANVATTYSPMHNSTVWITSETEKYQSELNDLLDRIGIEEKIHDWAYTVAGYGDLFVKPNGVPGLGVISVDDGEHPMAVSRVECDGTLVGFYKTPSGQTGGTAPGPGGQAGDLKLLPPWEYVHFRLLGAKKRRPKGGNSGYAENRQVHLISGGDTRQVSTNYGSSIVTAGLPAYKRLRLAEDSLLLARISRGLIRYIWKMKVDMTNMEAASALMDQYATLITRARAIDTGANASFDSKQNPMTAIEDIFIPVWGEVGDLVHDEIGGQADIRWIVDIEMLRNQLSFALATPAALGGAFVKEASGALGSEAITKLDIRFARSSRRLQRALINGIVRMCQIHLAYRGMDPDPSLFDVHMTETSTAEEESLRKSMEAGAKTFGTLMSTLTKVSGRKIDKEKVWEYYNEKIMRLDDFYLEDFYKDPAVLQHEAEMAMKKAQAAEQGPPPVGGKPGEEPPKEGNTIRLRPESIDPELLAALVEVTILERERKTKKRKSVRERRAVGTDSYSFLPVLLPISKKDKSLLEKMEVFKTKLDERIGEDKTLKKTFALMEMKSNQRIEWVIQRDAYSWYENAGEAVVKIEKVISEK